MRSTEPTPGISKQRADSPSDDALRVQPASRAGLPLEVALNPRVLRVGPGAAARAWLDSAGAPREAVARTLLVRLEGLEDHEARALASGAAAEGGRAWPGGPFCGGARGPRSLLIAVDSAGLERLLERMACAPAPLPEVARIVRRSVGGSRRRRFDVPCRGGPLRLGERLRIVGIVNVTPDSFSDGGRFLDPGAAVAHAEALARAGADVLDIGGESTRPGAGAVPPAEQCRRVLPVIRETVRRLSLPVSVDTTRAEVARRSLDAGASMVNDVSGLRDEPGLAAVAARHGAPLILMHRRGRPETMQEDPRYVNVISEICRGLRASCLTARRAGVPPEALIVDPGIGFGKTLEHNLEIFRSLEELRSLGRPILVGASRKSFLGALTGKPVGERRFATAASVAACVFRSVQMVRVHDVEEMTEVARVAEALKGAGVWGGGGEER